MAGGGMTSILWFAAGYAFGMVITFGLIWLGYTATEEAK